MDSQTQDLLRSLRGLLEPGGTFAAGGVRYKLDQAGVYLRNAETSRFAGFSAIQEKAAEDVLAILAANVARLLQENLQALTSKQYQTLHELAERGHPYAKSRWRPGIGGTPPAYIVNNQTGRVANDFTVQAVTSAGGVSQVLASNPALEAGLLVTGTTGKRAMIARPYDKVAYDRTKRQAAQDIADAAKLLSQLGANPSRAQMPQLTYVLGNVRKTYP